MALTGHSLATADGRLLAVDPEVCEIMLREERELVGTMFQSITHPHDIAGNVAALTTLRIQDGPLAIRKRYVRPDGSSVWSSVQVSRLNADDGSKLVGTIQLIDAPTPSDGPETLWRCARRLSVLMERRRTEFTDELFNDYPWMILLHVYIAEAEARPADLRSIMDGLTLRQSASERWLRVLETKGLIELSGWSGDSAQLTAIGMTKVERFLNSHMDV
ncbi:PAS domain S-box protein [Sphingomonas aliaeris]|uniref:PAS domain S-box protein n=1 Tax=Sphingomonas aliaeris TaxID=2759526 RepID=A0A974S4U7_9SPHN|nr:PAS domain S-box protein [Sphingomonas aliaeris]QQV77998.1 PAS domain S-box protein [Sphingomonas aliaeris]